MLVKDLLEASSSKPIIVVDVQPAYRNAIGNMAYPLMEFLNKQYGPKLMLINAEETGVSDDTKDSCIEYWLEHGLNEEVVNSLQIFDKGYGYIRAWMDNGVSPAVIIKVIRAMYQAKITDSREFPEGILEELVGKIEYSDWMLDDPISVEWLSIGLLRKFNNCYLCGGGEEECLAEVILLMNAFNIRYTLISKFTYGG